MLSQVTFQGTTVTGQPLPAQSSSQAVGSLVGARADWASDGNWSRGGFPPGSMGVRHRLWRRQDRAGVQAASSWPARRSPRSGHPGRPASTLQTVLWPLSQAGDEDRLPPSAPRQPHSPPLGSRADGDGNGWERAARGGAGGAEPGRPSPSSPRRGPKPVCTSSCSWSGSWLWIRQLLPRNLLSS